MKPLRISIDGTLRVHIKRLLKQGLNGRTEREVVIRLLCEKLRELQPQIVRRLF
jgi:hypothetical protein